ncbi:hypothetical protein HID58_000362 [Brassica napus]|uniref:Uncharacterized protein n=1 Tax=Brassica napus TaxID=3708 RepID=A0ABQ8EGI3_BRANA|nr:hypothetical protein HID58_000362 [Brassica napus]
MFEDADLVIFCVSLTDYGEYIEDIEGVLVNKMIANKQLFESMVTHPILADKSDTVDNALRYAREILKWHVEETSMFQ